MANYWTVRRHPGRGGPDAWKVWSWSTAKHGQDGAEDRARRVFEDHAARLKNGIVILQEDQRTVDEKAPSWVEEYIQSRLAKLPEQARTGDVRRLFSHH